MIDREDMLELTRRMTLKRHCFARVAGCYVDKDGDVDGTFNIHYLKLPPEEQERNLKIAKCIPFSGTNENLVEYSFPDKSSQSRAMWQLLGGIRSCGLKNDALLDTFYDQVIAGCSGYHHPYAIFVFFGSYDVPMKASDKERLWESEEVYDFLICAISPLRGEYEPGLPDCGFLFPAFSERSADLTHIHVYHREKGRSCRELTESVLGISRQ